MDFNKNNKKIAEFMGEDIGHDHMVIRHKGNKTVWTTMTYHESWDELMPVVRKIVHICCNDNEDDLFESDEYTSILETIPLAIMEDAYKVVIEFIDYFTKRNIKIN